MNDAHRAAGESKDRTAADYRMAGHPVFLPLPAIGRILLALIFVISGIEQIGRVAATSASMAAHGIPYAQYLVWGVIALDLGGGIMLIVGVLARLVAAVYFFYLLALAVMFHPYWTLSGAEARTQHGVFYEHLGMMGGMLFVVAFGAGPYSIDALIRRRHQRNRVAAAMSRSRPQ